MRQIQKYLNLNPDKKVPNQSQPRQRRQDIAACSFVRLPFSYFTFIILSLFVITFAPQFLVQCLAAVMLSQLAAVRCLSFVHALPFSFLLPCIPSPCGRLVTEDLVIDLTSWKA